MFKKITTITLIAFLSTNAYSSHAVTLDSLVKKASKCNGPNCPNARDFIKQPKVTKAIKKSFKNVGITPPQWIFNNQNVAMSTQYTIDKGGEGIYIEACQLTSICSSNSLKGWYDVKYGTFNGTLIIDGEEKAVY